MKTSKSTFSSCMHDQMLESKRDDIKLEAMRCITIMTAKGKLSVPRSLFPNVVKNVSSKNPELRKLIYLYLTNFADQEPDLALLPVATLQKSLKSPNPLVRSSALKILTSMRLNILSAVLLSTIRSSVNDLSPYVRKTTAHSITKIYRLDPESKEDLIEYIERLLNDKNSMVLSSAVSTFEVVCPERLDLVHKHYKRFCFLLADCNEWGQTTLLNLLKRYILKYAKSKKRDVDPKALLRAAKPLVHSNNSAVVMAVVKLYIAIANQNETRSTIARPLIRLLYSHREIRLMALNLIEELTNLGSSASNTERNDGDEKIDEDGGDEEDEGGQEDEVAEVDELNTESRVNEVDEVNESDKGNEVDGDEEEDDDDDDDDVEDENEDEEDEEPDEEREEEGEDEESESDEEPNDLAPAREDSKSESEDNRSDKKVESNGTVIDLTPIHDPQAFRDLFRPYIKSFFVKHTDCTLVRSAKLKILTNLSSPVNVTLVLRELQAYIATYVDDKEFVAASIQAIGRCSITVKEVAHICLNGLTSLLSNNNENVVAEAIVVLRSQIIDKSRSCGSMDQGESAAKDTKATSAVVGKDGDELDNDYDCELADQDEQTDEKVVSTVIKQVTRLLPKVAAPQARATILWILAEFCQKNITAAKCAPNVLRSIAKSFPQEDNFVKLQCFTLASKYLLSLDKEKKADLYRTIHLLTGYLFSLAKYDTNHDVRDRGRFLKKLLEDETICYKVLNCVC